MAFRTRPIVLIVEDDPVIAMTYEDAAIDAGASVGGPFLSCESAEKWLSVHHPDLAIIDIALQRQACEKAVRPGNSVCCSFWLFHRFGWH